MCDPCEPIQGRFLERAVNEKTIVVYRMRSAVNTSTAVVTENIRHTNAG